MRSPNRPLGHRLGMAGQLLAFLVGLVLLAINATVGLLFLAAALIAVPFTSQGWRWTFSHPKARLCSNSQLRSLTAGTWIVRPGSKYAVMVKDKPAGAAHNPTIADGLTREELEIICPVYIFKSTPKGSLAS